MEVSLVVLAAVLVVSTRGDPVRREAGSGSTSNKDCYIKTSTASRCYFPFTYKGVTYTECSWLDNDGYPWCYTSPNYRQDEQWAFCKAEVCEECYIPAFGGKSGETRCVFPFTYAGVEYTDQCSYEDNDGYPWCPTTPNYQQDNIWGFCRDEVCEETSKDIDLPDPASDIPPTSHGDCYVTTFGGSAGVSRCYFPFTFKGVTYTECSWDGNDGYPWCFTNPNYQQDKLWAFCDEQVCEQCYVPTFNGKAGDARCEFPFTFKGVVYNECSTVESDGYPWCYTTPNYEQDKLWAFCKEKVCDRVSANDLSRRDLDDSD